MTKIHYKHMKLSNKNKYKLKIIDNQVSDLINVAF